ncbi:hypothetical protein RHGRI_002943 [Rhododendron griersonianum]|uniref:Ribosomal protein S13 n=1 Tax=Rhododendron griersonianum TaxID=479676 RepID=A0AAV6LT69_9ERIC|nr:hypothetical protein RHGRI_002943 [Rhododendron griersonianum]
MFSSWAEFMEMLTDNGDLIVYVVGVFSTLQLYNGLDTKVEKSRKQMKERKNRAKTIRGVKKGFRGFLGSAAQEQLPQSETSAMSLVANEEFQHILRVQNTNVDGKQKIMFALTSIKGIGRRFSNIACKKADIDMNKRFYCYSFSLRFGRLDCLQIRFFSIPAQFILAAGELSMQELDNLMTIVANPRQFKIPDWFLNRKKDYKDGKFSQVTSNALDMKLRDDLERLKKISCSLLFFLVSIWTETIVVSVTTGVLGFAGSIPRPLAAGGRLLVSPRSDKIWF